MIAVCIKLLTLGLHDEKQLSTVKTLMVMQTPQRKPLPRKSSSKPSVKGTPKQAEKNGVNVDDAQIEEPRDDAFKKTPHQDVNRLKEREKLSKGLKPTPSR